MKFNPLALFGVVLVLLGIAGFIFGSVPVKNRETALQVGNLKVTAETQQNYPIPQWLSAAAIVVGLGLAVFAFVRKR